MVELESVLIRVSKILLSGQRRHTSWLLYSCAMLSKNDLSATWGITHLCKVSLKLQKGSDDPHEWGFEAKNKPSGYSSYPSYPRFRHIGASGLANIRLKFLSQIQVHGFMIDYQSTLPGSDVVAFPIATKPSSSASALPFGSCANDVFTKWHDSN